MKIKGELFSQQFIPKLLDGTKRRTSRPIKNLPDCGFVGMDINPEVCYDSDLDKLATLDGLYATFEAYGDCAIDFPMRKAKYQPGDVMYARETWMPETEQGCPTGGYIYKATDRPEPDGDYPLKWRPSIHMPREAARIFLRVTDVKVQRLDDLTEQDAVEDGFLAVFPQTALSAFKDFWRWQYGPDARWMWVYYFEPTSRDEALGGPR